MATVAQQAPARNVTLEAALREAEERYVAANQEPGALRDRLRQPTGRQHPERAALLAVPGHDHEG